MKKSVIDARNKTFLYYDETDAEQVEFKKHYLKYKKNSVNLPDTIERVYSKPGFVGSGRFVYKFNNSFFDVFGSANGRGFWGTDYSIHRITEQDLINLKELTNK
jgi:hypothetical protein